MTEGWNIALLGATGAVGEAILALLQEREFPVGELHLLASERSAGESLRFNNKSYQVQDATDFDWSQAQIAFFAAGEEASLYYAERAAQEGCIVIDTSGVFALEPDVPLVVPSVNPHVLADYRNRNIIALADSYVSQLLSATKPLIEAAGIGRITLTNMLSVSSYGKAAVDELAGHKQLAFNMLPMLADMEGSVQQERRLVEQVRKVLQDDGLPVAVSFIQSPVFYGNAQVVYLETLRPVGVEEARDELERFDDIQVSEEGDYPTQVTEASGNDRLSIGCIRNDYGIPEILQFWSVADNVRFGGALMAVETAEKLAQELFY
ncbi:aspartate-semialdehyde dehydrogenase [Providencia stuartii]